MIQPAFDWNFSIGQARNAQRDLNGRRPLLRDDLRKIRRANAHHLRKPRPRKTGVLDMFGKRCHGRDVS